MAAAGVAGAQTWSEDFTSAAPPGLPSGWMQNNVDGYTVNSALSAFNFGTNAWVTRNYNTTYPGHGNVAVSTSWYTSALQSNDWLITPQFTVPANAVLEWQAMAVDPSFPDGYMVKISTTGTATTDFTTTLYSTSAESATWTTRGANLSAYAGQTVYIAFINNANDKYLLLLDNIRVFVPPATDGNVVSITSTQRYKAGAGNQTISGNFRSLGYTAANNAELNFSVNNGAPVTEVITFGSPLNYGQTTGYTFTSPANLALGYNKIKVWVTKVNTVAETNLTNDTAFVVVYVASTTKPRKALIEEFSSSTCWPCQSVNLNFDPLLNNNTPNSGSDVNVIKYQMNWPNPGNDPSYNNHGLSRRIHYNVNGIPDAFTNGRTEMVNHSQAEINNAKLEPAYADITATLSAVKSSTAATAITTIAATATITPYVGIAANSPVRVFQALLENYYSFPGASTSQKDYYHIMRKMEPSGWGTPVTLTDGTSFTVGLSHNPVEMSLANTTSANLATIPPQMTYSFWTTPTITYEYVVFLQDTVSNHVLQSASWSATTTVPTSSVPPTNTTGIGEMANVGRVTVFPSPANDYATVSVELMNSENVSMTIYDVTGKVVYATKPVVLEAGRHDMTLSTADLAAGAYHVSVVAGDAVIRQRFVVAK